MNPGIIVSNGYTLTINGPVVGNPMHQWLNGFTAGEVTFGRISEIWSEWWGADSYGINDSNSSALTGSIQCAIAAAGGTEGVGHVSGGIGPHTKLRFKGGVYRTTVKITIYAGSWLDMSGASNYGTIIYHTGGSSDCLEIQGSFYQNQGAYRKYSYFDAGVHIHDIGFGSTTGHAVSLINAYCTHLENVFLLSADINSNYLNIDGCALVTGNNIKIAGNINLPSDWSTDFFLSITNGKYGVYITSTADGNGRYNASGEIFLTNLWVEAAQTQHAVYVYTPSTADFQIYPVYINGGDLIVYNGYAAIAVDKGIVIANDLYVESAAGGTVDAIKVISSQGESTVYATNIIADGCRLNFTGDATYPSTLVVTGGMYSSFVYTGYSYTYLNISDVDIADVRVSNAASTRLWKPVSGNTNCIVEQAPSGTATSAYHSFFGTSDTTTNTEFLQIGANIITSNRRGIWSNKTNAGVAQPIEIGVGIYEAILIETTGGISMSNLKSGASQVAAGAAANELWVDTAAGNVIKRGV